MERNNAHLMKSRFSVKFMQVFEEKNVHDVIGRYFLYFGRVLKIFSYPKLSLIAPLRKSNLQKYFH